MGVRTAISASPVATSSQMGLAPRPFRLTEQIRHAPIAVSQVSHPPRQERAMTQARTEPAEPNGSAVKRAVSELDRLILAFEDASEAVLVVDGEGRIIRANPASGRAFGCPASELVNRPIASLIAASDATDQPPLSGQAKRWTGEVVARHGNGGEFRARMSLTDCGELVGPGPAQSTGSGQAQGQGANRFSLAVLQEPVAGLPTPSANRAEAAWRALVENAPNIIQTQKMEAIGHLAVGIAHDFNNLLTAITSYIQLAMMRASPDERLHSYLEEADKASERAASLTRQLLAFSRKESVEPQTLDLNALIMEMDKLLHPLIGIGENIELWIELSAEPCLLKADRSQMEQVIMNLVINAVDAMPDGGKLTIKTGIVPGSAQSPGFEHQRHVSLEVADTGIGMDEKVKERIFEPFFTTKIPGKGTGLGLSTCYGIVTQMGGRIAVDSAPGKGAAFTVLIPQAEDAPKTL